MNILSIDVGTTSMRGILYDENGSVKTSQFFLTPLVFRDSYIEQTAYTLQTGLRFICQSISVSYKVDAISLTAFRSACALFDENGSALTNFIMWQDTRSAEICEELSAYDDEIHRRTGATVNAVFAGGKIAWFRRHMPEVYSRAYKVMVVPDYLLHRMCGCFVTDRTYGSRTNLMNIDTLEWDERMLELFDVDREKLCDLVDVSSIAGYVTEDFQKETGIPAGIPVITSGGDQQNGALGLGMTDSASRMINCGTGAFISTLVDKPCPDVSSMICNVAAIPGRYVLEASVLASGSALNWMIRELFPEHFREGLSNFKAVDEIAASAPAGAGGVMCIPLLQGCGTRDFNPEARASFSNISLSTTRADIARSLMEGIAAETVKSFHAIPSSSEDVRSVIIGGGVTKSNIFNQILCDMLGIPVMRYTDEQATSIGAYMNASAVLGVHPSRKAAFEAARKNSRPISYVPDEKNHALYQEYLKESERVYRLLNR